jgi:murein DD-endopeptidase MepM/ murein hydrolase activator NlpD
LPEIRAEEDIYVVQPGDTLLQIARIYSLTVEQIVAHNQLSNPDLLEVGQVLAIPAPAPLDTGPSFKIVPNSELVHSPSALGFDHETFIRQAGGYLARQREEVQGELLTGPEIVTRIAQNYSVHPRILLALIEHQTGWVRNPDPAEKVYAVGLVDPARDSLYRQLAWAADSLNYGYYAWRVGGVSAWGLADGSLVPPDPTINAGTAAVQFFFARLYGPAAWQQAVSEPGLADTYERLFGYPFADPIDPLIPEDLVQPELILPFEPGIVWNFTGGPHGGWDSGSAWAALDFAPPGEALGCVVSEEWVTAVADGVVARTGDGQVLLDLDGDGLEQTGWVMLFMHIESRDRVQPGDRLMAGDRIGHPSCEGGFSTGTHLHIARKYNGEWIPADQPWIPFVMDGWIASGSGSLYDGWLSKANLNIEADNGRAEENEISR